MVLGVNLWIRRRFTSFAILSTSILSVIGFKNPEHVDLDHIDSIARKKVKGETGQYPPTDGAWVYRY